MGYVSYCGRPVRCYQEYEPTFRDSAFTIRWSRGKAIQHCGCGLYPVFVYIMTRMSPESKTAAEILPDQLMAWRRVVPRVTQCDATNVCPWRRQGSPRPTYGPYDECHLFCRRPSHTAERCGLLLNVRSREKRNFALRFSKQPKIGGKIFGPEEGFQKKLCGWPGFNTFDSTTPATLLLPGYFERAVTSSAFSTCEGIPELRWRRAMRIRSQMLR